MRNLLSTHTPVSLAITAIAFFLGYDPFIAAALASVYWAGREVAQAEERFIVLHTPNRRRDEMHPLTAYYNRRAWSVKGFWGDMIIPAVLAFGLAYILAYII